MKVATHNGYFHADDVLAVAVFLLKYPKAEILRARDEGVIRSADAAIDVGRVYDPDTLRFDHHQRGGAGERGNGIPYASLGLIWKHFGEEVAYGKREAEIVERRLVMAIDALDNGVEISTPLFKSVSSYTIADYLDSFNDGRESLEDFDRGFSEALFFGSKLLMEEIDRAKAYVRDLDKVGEIFRNSKDKEIIELPPNIHWKEVLVPTEAKFVVFPRNDGDFYVRAVPKEVGEFTSKIPFPESWGGLVGEELAGTTGVKDASFCHRDGFIAGASSREGALRLAELALGR